METDPSKKIIKSTLKEHDDSGYMEGTPEERIEILLELTEMAWSLANPEFDPNAPMRKDVVKLIRPGDKPKPK